MTGEWCGPTAQLSSHKLAVLLDRTRRCTGRQPKRTDPQAPLTDPWFEDSGAVRAPDGDPTQPIDIEPPRERKERTKIPPIVVAPRPAYPIYRERFAAKVARVALGVGAIALVVTVGLALA